QAVLVAHNWEPLASTMTRFRRGPLSSRSTSWARIRANPSAAATSSLSSSLRQLLAGQAVRTEALVELSLLGPRSHRCLGQVQVRSDGAGSVGGLAYCLA